MKRFFFLPLFSVFVLAVSAQSKVGTLSFIPKVGVNLSNVSGSDILFGVQQNAVNASPKYKAGFAGGAEFEYQLQPQYSLSLGVLYSLQGCRYKDISDAIAGKAGQYTGYSNMAMNLHYVQVPLLFSGYVAPGLAIKAGLQAGFLLEGKMKYDETTFIVNRDGGTVYDTPSPVSIDIKPSFHTFDMAIPLGISYEYGHVVMDVRYNFPLTKAEKEIGSKNKCFTFSVGYKFEILR